jgi:glycine cleavage system regulatory protein
VGQGETARELWERALAPIGLSLLTQVARHARLHGNVPVCVQDERHATKAPMIRRSVVMTEETTPATTSVVVTIMGPDRPGIVSLLSDRAQRHGANWAASRLGRFAQEFAGMVHFEVPRDNADALVAALQGLESTGLRLAIAKSDDTDVPGTLRSVELSLVADDRIGIVSQLTRMLAERGISIENIQTEIVRGGTAGKTTFKVHAHLLVPAALSMDILQREVGALAHEMTADLALGERPAG